jgi:hypothetical protein
MNRREISLAILVGMVLSVLVEPTKAYFELAVSGSMSSFPSTWIYPLLKYVAGPFGAILLSGAICMLLGLIVEEQALLLGVVSGAIGTLISEGILLETLAHRVEHTAVLLEAAALIFGAGMGSVFGNWIKRRIWKQRILS